MYKCKDCGREIDHKGYCKQCVRDAGANRSEINIPHRGEVSPSFENAVKLLEDGYR